jgi:hypothetical protein
MNITNWLNLLTILLVLVVLALVIYGVRIAELYFRATNKNIRDSVQIKSIELSPTTSSIVELAVEIWRLEKRLSKAEPSLTDDQNKSLQNSIAKMHRYLDRNDISFVDYTDQKFNEGLNLEILSKEKDPKLSESIIKETHEPAVMHKGQLIKKAKVVVLEK